MQTIGPQIVRFLTRTPAQTFLLCPLVVIAFEFAWHGGRPPIVWWGVPLLLWGYLQYKLVGGFRHPRAGGTPGMETPPDRIVDYGPYRYTRNPMYLGHLIFLAGLALTFWSWFARDPAGSTRGLVPLPRAHRRGQAVGDFRRRLRRLSRARETLDSGRVLIRQATCPASSHNPR